MIADNSILLYHASLAAVNKVITAFFFKIRAKVLTFYSVFVLIIVDRPFQISLNQKFKEALSGLTMSVSALRLDEHYKVTHAKRIETRHGTRVVLTLLEKDDRIVSVFLPKRYGDAMEDSDITDNNRRLQYHLIYRGKSSVSSALCVDIEL
jgi:hypothetical protein